MQHYRNFSQASQQRSPHSTQARRGPGPMVAPPAHPSQQPQMTAAQMQAQQIEAARRGDLARRQSRKPTDRDISEDVGEVIVGDGVQRYMGGGVQIDPEMLFNMMNGGGGGGRGGNPFGGGGRGGFPGGFSF